MHGPAATACHAITDNAATIVYLANQGCVELHAFLSQVSALDEPDQLILDFDPPAKVTRPRLDGRTPA